MIALVCETPSAISALQFVDVASSALPPGHVRIRMSYVALNPPDALMAQGKYQVQPEPPFVVGVEGSGIVVETAADRAGSGILNTPQSG